MSKNLFILWTVSTLFVCLAINGESVEAQQEQQIPIIEQLLPIIAPQPFDKASINGSWKPIKGLLAGHELPKEQLESIQLTINNGAYETRGTGFVESGKMVIPVPVTDKPQAIDVVIENGENAGTTMQGIVRVDGEKLIVCYAITGERPASFESQEGGQDLLLEYVKVEMMTIVTPHIIIQEEEEQLQVGVGSDGKK